MCGIAGIVTAAAGGIEAATIHRMCQTIVHRGPDEEGIFVSGGCGFGMRRLSIIDLVGGHQPVFNEDRSSWIVFNGEIFNFSELRRELETRGHHFSTRTDTEVILHLYEELGADCVRKLRGMFAFAIYDERRRSLLMARDRLGIKPLHYAFVDGRLLFGSEISAILAAAPELATLSHESLRHYMYFGYIPDPATAFVSIRKLPPGHLLEFERGAVQVRKYWDLPPYGTNPPASEEECLEEMESRLAEAVRIALVADVPLGALLSGGTDSSTVVALMARASSRPVKTFSIGFRHADFDESRYARLVAEKFATEHYELVVEPDLVATVESLTRSLEEPFGDSSMLPTYYISRLARQHVTVVLSGDGGDELFAGYERYPLRLRSRAFDSLPAWAGGFYREHIHRKVPYGFPGRNRVYNALLPPEERYLEGISLRGFEREISLLGDDFRVSANGHSDPLNLFRKYLAEAPAQDLLSRVLYLDTKTYLPGDILAKVDRMSMVNSLEARVPLLDHAFVEWVTGLPPQWKMRARSQKYIFRKLAERVGVPIEVLDRRKQGFALPVVHWMRHELKHMVLTVLLEPRTLQRGYFNPQGIRRLMDEHFQRRRDHSARIWRFLMFELWHRNFVEKLGANDSKQPADDYASLGGGAG